MHCTNCGKSLAEGAKFCDGCGSPIVTPPQGNVQAPVQNAPAGSAEQENKVIFILSYLGILFFLPLVSCPNSKTGRFHANQGLVLLITAVAGQIALAILSAILFAIATWRLLFFISGLTAFLNMVWGVAMLVLMIIGMMNANKGEQKPLPVIGKISIIK